MIDLGIFHRKDHEIGIKESLILSSFYITIALLFGAWVWYSLGTQSGEEYLAGYLIEKSLSIDNIFVISIIFSYLQIPRIYQHRVIFWGVLGVIILRGIMIGIGATLVAEYEWVLYLFAIFLIFTGIKMLFVADKNIDLSKNRLLQLIKKVFPVTEDLHGNKFIVSITDPNTQKNKLFITPLLVALLMVEFTDLMFAVDSIPAIFAITTDTYVVYTSNIFAILGLRALYFALAAILHSFEYLKYALSLVLIFIGAKIFIADLFGIAKFPTDISLAVTVTLIAGGILVSVFLTNKKQIIKWLVALFHQHHKDVVDHKLYRWFSTKSNHSNYLALNKDSVSRGVAMGLFAALIPMPVQMLVAIALSIIVKGNLIIAALCTWVTNPFTFVPLNFFIYQVGNWILHEDPSTYSNVSHFDWHGKSVGQIINLAIDWLQALGKPFLVGLPIVAISCSIIGYVLSRMMWNYISKHIKTHINSE